MSIKQNCHWGDISEPHGEAAARPLLNEQLPCPAQEQW